MARTIICGLDDSAGAREAARAAVGLGTGLDLSVLLAHVIWHPVTIGGAAPPHAYPGQVGLETLREAGDALLAAPRQREPSTISAASPPRRGR